MKKTNYINSTFVFLISLGIGISMQNACSQTLSGTVTDSITGSPIKNATVTLKAAGKAAMTDDQGKFSFSVSVVQPATKIRESENRIAVRNNRISFIIAGKDLPVRIAVYNLSGKMVMSLADKEYTTGSYILYIPMEKLRSTGIIVLNCRIGASENAFVLPMSLKQNSIPVFGQYQNPLKEKTGSAANTDTLISDRYGYYSNVRQLQTVSGDVAIKLRQMPANGVIPPGMKLIDSCNFIMGSQKGDANETPEHEVALSSYFVDSTEVTQLDYETIVKARPWDNSSVQLPGGKGAYHPAWGVNWYDAVYYCNKRSKRDGLDTVYGYLSVTGTPGDGCTLDSVKTDFIKTGYRLLTEAEWEYAYGTGKQTAYLWGETGDSATYYAWISDNSGNSSHEVAKKLPNSLVLYDMGGNLYEWLNDWYRSSYPQTLQINPTGPNEGTKRVYRGGAWNVRADFLRITKRFSGTLSANAGVIGFRVALPKR